MGVRRKSRELALQILFQWEFERELDLEQGLALYRESFDNSPELWEYAKTLVRGVLHHREKIDSVVQSNSSHWKLERMSLVDRNILRVGTFEILFMKDEVPANVAINEAIEVAKKYGTTDSGGFVNGILDQIGRMQ
jgi:N utilization substance protein B